MLKSNKSWFQIVSSHSARSICSFQHCSPSDPSVHHWSSLELHSASLNLTSQVGRSRLTWEGKYPKHSIWLPGYPRDQFLDLFSIYIPVTHFTGTWFFLLLICCWYTVLIFISTRQSHSSCTDQTAWRTSQYGWKNITYNSTCQRQSFLSSQSEQHNFTIQLGSSTKIPSSSRLGILG